MGDIKVTKPVLATVASISGGWVVEKNELEFIGVVVTFYPLNQLEEAKELAAKIVTDANPGETLVLVRNFSAIGYATEKALNNWLRGGRALANVPRITASVANELAGAEILTCPDSITVLDLDEII